MTILLRELRNVKPGLPEQFPENDHFRNDWNMDSLELVEFVARIEQHFEIMIPDEDLTGLYSLKATDDYLKRHKKI